MQRLKCPYCNTIFNDSYIHHLKKRHPTVWENSHNVEWNKLFNHILKKGSKLKVGKEE